jgi:hypothetical protein
MDPFLLLRYMQACQAKLMLRKHEGTYGGALLNQKENKNKNK